MINLNSNEEWFDYYVKIAKFLIHAKDRANSHMDERLIENYRELEFMVVAQMREILKEDCEGIKY
jgi:hypothetical protein